MKQIDHIRRRAVVNLADLANASRPARGRSHRPSIVYVRPQRLRASSARGTSPDQLDGGSASASNVALGGAGTFSFNGISSIDMQTGGTGSYANTNSSLEPPDQGLCSAGNYVMETVNDSLRVYTTSGTPLTPKSVPLAQFFGRAAGGTTGPTDFISDPRCIYDPMTQRWFVTILDLTSATYPAFQDDQNFVAVSQTSNPMGNWYIYSFDVTDNGLHGTPLHPGCVGPPVGTLTVAGCLGDQPTLGTDRYGVYITDNEYAFAEVFPVAPPVGPPLQQIPVLRSGVAQLYALSKSALINGKNPTLVRYDTSGIPFPGSAADSPWQSISPATPVPGDKTSTPANGAEYFLSDVGLPIGHNANQIAVWAWSNTKSLDTASPNLTLHHTIINTASARDTFFAPDPSAPSSQPFAAYQKDGPHPLASKSGDPEEYLNANDDRMNWVTLSNGKLWTAVNTLLPPTQPGASGHAGENRVGIMYFQVKPSLRRNVLKARTVRDGYVQVPNANVMFGSIGPRADGAAVMSFTLTGTDYFPSLAWARLDGLAPGAVPQVHLARLGAAPEDGFTGLGLLGSQGLGLPDVPPCGPCVARWGDYSATEVAPSGCIWGAAEYIPTGIHDSLGATDWGTGVYRVCPPAIPRRSHKARHAPKARHATNAGGLTRRSKRRSAAGST
jgi:hypothetical protein